MHSIINAIDSWSSSLIALVDLRLHLFVKWISFHCQRDTSSVLQSCVRYSYGQRSTFTVLWLQVECPDSVDLLGTEVAMGWAAVLFFCFWYVSFRPHALILLLNPEEKQRKKPHGLMMGTETEIVTWKKKQKIEKQEVKCSREIGQNKRGS